MQNDESSVPLDLVALFKTAVELRQYKTLAYSGCCGLLCSLLFFAFLFAPLPDCHRIQDGEGKTVYSGCSYSPLIHLPCDTWGNTACTFFSLAIILLSMMLTASFAGFTIIGRLVFSDYNAQTKYLAIIKKRKEQQRNFYDDNLENAVINADLEPRLSFFAKFKQRMRHGFFHMRENRREEYISLTQTPVRNYGS